MHKVKGKDWIQTRSGRKFFVMDAQTEDVCIEDIAHALSNICRFTGHTSEFYSVAEHSVRVARYLDSEYPDLDQRPGKGALYGEYGLFGRELAFIGLMHDATEAYLGDVSSPLKYLPEYVFYREIEHQLSEVIAERFHFQYPYPDSVKKADVVLLGTEARDLMSPCTEDWNVNLPTLKTRIRPWSPEVARRQFLTAFKLLNPRTDPRRIDACKLTGETP